MKIKSTLSEESSNEVTFYDALDELSLENADDDNVAYTKGLHLKDKPVIVVGLIYNNAHGRRTSIHGYKIIHELSDGN